MTASNPSSNLVTIQAIPPQSVATASPVTVTAISVAGFRYAMFELSVGAISFASSLTIKDCATSGGTYVTIVDDGLNLGETVQTAGMSLSATVDNSIQRGQIDLDQCEDFLEFTLTVGGSGQTALAALNITLVGPEDTARHVRPVYLAEPLQFDIKHRLKAEAY